MDNFFRLALLVLSSMLATFLLTRCPQANAGVLVEVTGLTYTVQPATTTFPPRSSLGATGADCVQFKDETDPPPRFSLDHIVKISSTSGQCYVKVTATGSIDSVHPNISVSGTEVCPAHSHGPAVDYMCTCDTGYVEIGGSCELDPGPCAALSAAGSTFGGSGFVDLGLNPNSPNLSQCDAGTHCEVRFSGSITNRVLVGGVYHYFGTGTLGYSGQTCSSGADAQPGSLPNPTCSSGQVLGTFNGVSTCLASGVPTNPNNGQPQNPTQTGPTTTTETSTGGGTTTTTSTTSNPNGSTSTTTKTCDSSGNCEETTETTGEDPTKSFCEENPKAKICEEKEGSASGSCSGSSAVVSCEGDAIQCAIYREQMKQDCIVNASTDESALYSAVKAGTDSGTTDNPALLANRESVSLSSAIDESSHFSGSCIPDINTTVAGHSVTIGFSNLCSILSLLGSIGVMCSLVGAAVIVGRG